MLKLCAEIAFPLFVILFGKTFTLSDGKASRWIEYIGINSYPIYLLHKPYITPVVVIIMLQMNAPILISVLSGILVGILGSLFIYKWIIIKIPPIRVLFMGGR